MLLLTDIASLVVVPPGPLRGAAMRSPRIEHDAELLIGESGRIAWFGPRPDCPAPAETPRLSAEGGCVLPGLIDCHTHIPFAGDRSAEFVRRLAGESYLSIMQAGGGIRVTTAAVRGASIEQLVEQNLPRLGRMLALGVTTVECKSGYGLAVEHELKQLRTIQSLARTQPIELVPTYLGAHALPAEFEGRADAFIQEIGSTALFERLARERLASFVDVFCDRGAFDAEQSRRYLAAAAARGLKLKLHADELAQIGATRLAAELGAISADHLEHIDEGGIEALRRSGTIAVVLPGTSFFLGIEHCNARRLIEAGLAVAIATDLNPGSSHIESLPFVMNIACCQLRLLPIELVAACTANAAAAIGEAHRLGAIAVGHEADLLVLSAPSPEAWLYSPGRSRVRRVLKRGQVVFEDVGRV